MNKSFRLFVAASTVITATFLTAASFAQTPPTSETSSTYQPKFAGDPARSDSEAAALAYMRVVIRAQHHFEKQYGHFAISLAELVHTGSFTKRMVNPDRGDYTASFKGKKDSFILTMTPSHLDSVHRSFYAEDDGKIHAEETKPADADSPVVK
jgi:HAMP domain-containing protein